MPACPPSARAVGRQLAGLGFAVVESVDKTRGETAAAIAEFARRLREAPGARVVVYACGPIAELEGRAFILPSSATLDRPTDVLTQGVLLRSLPDMLVQGRVGAALFALDAFTETPRLPALPAPSGDAALGLILSSQAGREGQRTALASALLGELVEPAATGADVGTLLTRLQARLEGEAGRPQHRVERPSAAVALLPAPPPADPAP
ncbi:caspase family protein, partial [Roseomonas hellenica]